MAPPNPNRPKSATKGVTWDKKTGKWQGRVCDQNVRVGEKAKVINLGLFVLEKACADAVNAKREEIEAANAKDLHAMAQDLLHTHGLPPRPAKAVDAKLKTAYYGEKRLGAPGEAKEFGPARYVCVVHNSNPGGFQYTLCCQEFLDSGEPCTKPAVHDGKYCLKHGESDTKVPKSATKGVGWTKKSGKWTGTVFDRSVRVGANAKKINIGSFDDEQECADAVNAKHNEIDAKLHTLAQELPHTRGLPPRPAKAVDAKPDTAYYAEKGLGALDDVKEFGPTRYVRIISNSVPGGFVYVLCCRAFLNSGAPCTTQAMHDGKHCILHGGGHKAGEGGAGCCTHCKTIQISQKRKLLHGGNGLCPTCEAHLTDEAAANGSDAPVKSQRWEKVFFEQLLPLLTYADGDPFPPDQSDLRKGGGLGTSRTKKRGRECDTTTNRFPDILFVLRDEDGRALLVLIIEVDEHSHGDRDPECESGKIDDTFQALQVRLAAERGASGRPRHDAQMVPIVTIRANPNAYDVKPVKLSKRVKAVAKLANSYLQLDAAACAQLQTKAPIVHVLYYHTKEAKEVLLHYAAKAGSAQWDYTVHAP